MFPYWCQAAGLQKWSGIQVGKRRGGDLVKWLASLGLLFMDTVRQVSKFNCVFEEVHRRFLSSEERPFGPNNWLLKGYQCPTSVTSRFKRKKTVVVSIIACGLNYNSSKNRRPIKHLWTPVIFRGTNQVQISCRQQTLAWRVHLGTAGTINKYLKWKKRQCTHGFISK